ncbi:MAG: hypothetical protein QY310_03530 [Candidatus Jettenia sp. CY-1]|nr:MAG: hypothetical protein QY310_03530 [Candidatus Jettenia sp. CY-1]
MLILVGIILASIILRMEKTGTKQHHEHAHEDTALHHKEDDEARGPHGGKLVSEAGFQMEILIYEQGIPLNSGSMHMIKGKGLTLMR